MAIVVDTSALIDSLTGPRRSADQLRGWIEQGERLELPTLVAYEWLRGPRLEEELKAPAALFPAKSWIPFGTDEARLAAELYRELPRGVAERWIWRWPPARSPGRPRSGRSTRKTSKTSPGFGSSRRPVLQGLAGSLFGTQELGSHRWQRPL